MGQLWFYVLSVSSFNHLENLMKYWHEHSFHLIEPHDWFPTSLFSFAKMKNTLDMTHSRHSSFFQRKQENPKAQTNFQRLEANYLIFAREHGPIFKRKQVQYFQMNMKFSSVVENSEKKSFRVWRGIQSVSRNKKGRSSKFAREIQWNFRGIYRELVR